MSFLDIWCLHLCSNKFFCISNTGKGVCCLIIFKSLLDRDLFNWTMKIWCSRIFQDWLLNGCQGLSNWSWIRISKIIIYLYHFRSELSSFLILNKFFILENHIKFLIQWFMLSFLRESVKCLFMNFFSSFDALKSTLSISIISE